MKVFEDKFDSKVFNKKVGKIYLNRDDDISLIRKLLNKTDFKMVCLFVEIKERSRVYAILRNLSFKYITTQCTLFKKITNVSINNDSSIKEYKKQSDLDLLPIVYTISSSSRLAQDEEVPPVLVRKYYKEWINNSINTSLKTVLINKYNSSICGMLSLKYQNSRKAKIDLFGILPDFRKQGIGTKLLNSAEKHCLSKGIRQMELTTSLSNQMGLNFYLKNGFFIKNIILVFHRHLV